MQICIALPSPLSWFICDHHAWIFKVHGLFEAYRFACCLCGDITCVCACVCVCSTGAVINSQRSSCSNVPTDAGNVTSAWGWWRCGQHITAAAGIGLFKFAALFCSPPHSSLYMHACFQSVCCDSRTLLLFKLGGYLRTNPAQICTSYCFMTR